MELRHLRYFVAVAEELHYGRAAQRLHVAQPGLSQQIKAFERELGAELFARNRRGVALTEAGAALLPAARDVLARADAAAELVRRHASGEAGRLTVSLTRSAPGGAVTDLVDGFRAANPAVDLQLTSGFTALHEQRLRERAIDAAFVRPPIDRGDDLAVLEIGTEAIVAAVRGDDPLARRRRLRTADVTGRPLVWWPREHGPGMWDRMLDQVFGDGVRPPVAHWEPEEERMLHAVAQGHGITFITEGKAGTLSVPGVVVRRFADPVPTVPIALAWHRDDRNPALRRFVAHARGMVAE
ncbi:LysR family transcriptional regulator [Actinomadura opuntiae]|uniref:LysR family transcriptional regulator n=1 Tax=Actinomadura sp. OS1-43 TaxID=604315 RepID=UPI00255AE233|nr:LysR substrate-binding domain-containing protein [Actinomadura sp. OS1-43]MDL4818394.1 LysR substrate-binding domain-containing protein [Actinomadura sp. OS1-43]